MSTQSNKSISKELLQESYRDQFLKKEHFSFTFSANGKLKVSYSKGHNDPDEYLSDRLVQRLLNADDMRKHLPLEVESQMAAKPQKEIEIATRFAEEFLTFSFRSTTILPHRSFKFQSQNRQLYLFLSVHKRVI